MVLALNDRQPPSLQASEQTREDHSSLPPKGHAPEDGGVHQESGGALSPAHLCLSFRFTSFVIRGGSHGFLFRGPSSSRGRQLLGCHLPRSARLRVGRRQLRGCGSRRPRSPVWTPRRPARRRRPLAAPRTWAAISADPEALPAGALAQLVTPRRVPGERLRINITIDKGLLRVADEAAEAAGLTRSGFIERALEAATDGGAGA